MTCSLCKNQLGSRVYKGRICHSCYMLSRKDNKCIRCEITRSSRWYKGPLCGGCYSSKTVKENRSKEREPCPHCGITTSSTKNSCSNCFRKKIRKNYISSRFGLARSNARRRNLSWELTLSEYSELVRKPCHYCQTPILKGPGASLDRIDNLKGYELSNVLPCCGSCNIMRHTQLTVEEMEVAMKAVLDLRKSKILETAKRIMEQNPELFEDLAKGPKCDDKTCKDCYPEMKE